MKLKKTIFNLSIFAGIQYVVLTTIAMFLYPGSTRLNTHSTHYLFTENFLSDLGRTTVFNGENNLTSAILYGITLTIVGVAMVTYFFIIPSILSNKGWLKYLSYIMSVTGVLAGLCFIGIAFTPSNLYYTYHMFFVFNGFKLLLFSLIILLICEFFSDSIKNIFSYILLFAVFLLFIYILLISYGPIPSSSNESLQIQVVGQKIIVYVLILSISIQAIGARKAITSNNIVNVN